MHVYARGYGIVEEMKHALIYQLYFTIISIAAVKYKYTSTSLDFISLNAELIKSPPPHSTEFLGRGVRNCSVFAFLAMK